MITKKTNTSKFIDDLNIEHLRQNKNIISANQTNKYIKGFDYELENYSLPKKSIEPYSMKTSKNPVEIEMSEQIRAYHTTPTRRKLDYLKSLEDEKVINSEYKQFATQNIEHDFLNLPPNPRSHAKVIEQKASNEFILEFEEKLKFKAYKCMSLSHDVKVGDTVLYEIFGNECFILHVLKNS